MELRNNQGILFQNKKMKDNHPDYTGEININGKVMKIALWKKLSSKNTEYFSLQVSDKEYHSKEKVETEQKEEPVSEYKEMDDFIPFDV